MQRRVVVAGELSSIISTREAIPLVANRVLPSLKAFVEKFGR